MLSIRLKKQTSKNVADTTYKSLQVWLNSVQQHQGEFKRRCWPENVHIVANVLRIENKC